MSDQTIEFQGNKGTDKFVGTVVNGEMVNGIYKFHSGDTYEGEFKDGKFHGQGTYTYAENKHVYTGMFSNGYFDGVGRLEMGNYLYEGSFKKDNPDGDGRLTHEKSGLEHKGKWQAGRCTA